MEKKEISRREHGRDFFITDPFETMPLELMMLVEVRCDALKEYRKMSDSEREHIEKLARHASCREEKERLIDAVANGKFGIN